MLSAGGLWLPYSGDEWDLETYLAKKKQRYMNKSELGSQWSGRKRSGTSLHTIFRGR